MAKEIENEEGVMETWYSPAELEQQKTEAIDAVKADSTKTIEEKDAEILRLNKVSAEKTDNFRKYNEMTEEERKAHTENEIIQIRRNDKLEEELGGVKKTLEEKEIRERDYAKTSVLKAFHGDKEEVKKVIEEKYAILSGMPETTPDEIRARATEAAKLAGINVNSQPNPLYQGFSGASPEYKEKTQFVETAEGEAAAQMVRDSLGITSPDKK